MFPNIYDRTNCKLFLRLGCLSPSPLAIYLFTVWNNLHWLAAKALICLLTFFPYVLIIFPITTDHKSTPILSFFIFLISLWSSNILWFWATQIPKSDRKNGNGSLESIDKKDFVTLSWFWPLKGWRKGLDESVEKGKLLTEIFFQKMLEEVLKSWKKNHICWFKNWCKTTKNTRASKCVLLVSVNKMSILTLN